MMAEEQDSSSGEMMGRLTDRLDRSQLHRVTMPGGGEVFRGDIATRALDALGARAMTVDRTIIVNDDFDSSNPEDQALFAHEQFHAEQGDGQGGGGGDNFRDAEEVAARAVERMALHRAMNGGYEAGYSEGAGGGTGDPMTGSGGGSVGAGSGQAAKKASQGAEEPSVDRGYEALVSQGYNHGDIVLELANRIMQSLDERTQLKQDRHGDKKGFI
jgi:hypothetical protein